MYYTPAVVALMVAIMFRRSAVSSARLSIKTLRLLSNRNKYLRGAFLADLRRHLEDLDIVAVPLDRGGFGLIAISALEGAPAIKAQEFLADEWPSIERG